jgi:hypothetical protein
MDVVYVETSFISHATAWPSPDIQTAAMQFQAREWWAIERSKFEIVTSQLVIAEASAGDAVAAADRLLMLQGVRVIPITAAAQQLADRILKASLMPPVAAADALHVAIAAVQGVRYLLTWNCRHIANAHVIAEHLSTARERGL